MSWKILSWTSGAASAACMITMLILNPTTLGRIEDTPWLLGFMVFMVAAVLLWARSERPNHQSTKR
jgi:hypothetical protein